MQLSHQISRHLSGSFCEIHNMNPTVASAKGAVRITVCCNLFKENLKHQLDEDFGADFVKKNIRFQLPAATVPGISNNYYIDD